MKKVYLHQFLTKTGLFESKVELIRAVRNGEIKIDDRPVINPYFQFRPTKKTVYWKGKPIKEVEGFVYIILHKPEGFLSSRPTDADRRRGKKSVFELIDDDPELDELTKKSLFTVGRLDEDSTGLLIITNDGKFCTKMTNPKYEVPKTYRVVLEKRILSKDIEKIQQGVVIELEENGKITQYKTKGCKVKACEGRALEITLSEGKKREVKRIFAAVGNKVIALERTAIGNLKLEELGIKKGSYVKKDLEFLKKIIS